MRTRPIRLWIEALESGKYPQGEGRLCETDEDGVKRYCCLGVACEIAVQHGVIPPGTPGTRTHLSDTGYATAVVRYGANRESTHLPDEVARWLDLDPGDYGNPRLGDTTAVEANDTHKWDFDRIARALREHYLSE